MTVVQVETYEQDGAWHSRVVGHPRPFASGGTMDEQIEIGRERALAESAEYVLHDEDGRVVERVDFRHGDLGHQHALDDLTDDDT